MRQEYGQVEGNIELNDHLALYGLCAGDITVHDGGALHLYGMCAGNVDVKPGGCARIYGLCTGDVINHGGELEVRGMVIGDIQKKGGTTVVQPGAKVRMAE